MASLQELLTQLAGQAPESAGPAELLHAHGFELSAEELTQALVSFAQTAPVEIATVLQPYVMAHGPVPLDAPVPGDLADPAGGLRLLAEAPVTPTGLDRDPTAELDSGPGRDPATDRSDLDQLGDLGFGTGSGPVAAAGSAAPALEPSPGPAPGQEPPRYEAPGYESEPVEAELAFPDLADPEPDSDTGDPYGDGA